MARKQAAPLILEIPHVWIIPDEIKVPVGDVDFIPVFCVHEPAGQTVHLVKARYKLNGGTSATVDLEVDGSGATGFTGLSVTTTVAEATPTAIALAEDNEIAPVVTGVAGTPMNMTFEIILRYTIL